MWNILDLIFWWVIAIFNFGIAYKMKNNEHYKDEYLKNITIKEDGEIVTLIRHFNSKVGYLRYKYVSFLIWGSYAFIYGVVYHIIKQNTGNEIIVLIVVAFIIDFIIYKRCKNI